MVTTPAVARIQFLTSSTLAPPFYILIITKLFTTVNSIAKKSSFSNKKNFFGAQLSSVVVSILETLEAVKFEL